MPESEITGEDAVPASQRDALLGFLRGIGVQVDLSIAVVRHPQRWTVDQIAFCNRMGPASPESWKDRLDRMAGLDHPPTPTPFPPSGAPPSSATKPKRSTRPAGRSGTKAT